MILFIAEEIAQNFRLIKMDVLYVKIEILESQNETFQTENSTLKSENSMLKMLLKENIAFTNRIVEILAKMDVLLETKRNHHILSLSNVSHDIQNAIPDGGDVKMHVLEDELMTSNETFQVHNQNPDFGTNDRHLDEICDKETEKMDLSDHQPTQQSNETNHVTSMINPPPAHQSHDLGAIDLNGLQDFDIDLPALTCGTGIQQMKDEYQYSQVEPMTPPSEPASQHSEHIAQSEPLNVAPRSDELSQQTQVVEQTIVNVQQWQDMSIENSEVTQFKEEYQQYGQQPMTPPCEPPSVPPCDSLSQLPLSECQPNNQTHHKKVKGTKSNGKAPSRKKQKIEHDNPYFAQNDHGYFICPYDTCSTTMKHRHALVEHIRIHTGEKPFKCAICSKRFRCAGTIRKHLKTVHKSEMASHRSQEISQMSLQMTSEASDDLQ